MKSKKQCGIFPQNAPIEHSFGYNSKFKANFFDIKIKKCSENVWNQYHRIFAPFQLGYEHEFIGETSLPMPAVWTLAVLVNLGYCSAPRL